MSSEVQSQLSKRSTISIGGNLGVTGKAGGGAATAVLRHQISSASLVEFVASAGLRLLLGVQTTRNMSNHSTATMGLPVLLEDGSVNLSNSWSRQLSETSNGNIQLILGSESSIAVGWQKKQEKMAAAGEIKLLKSSDNVYFLDYFDSSSTDDDDEFSMFFEEEAPALEALDNGVVAAAAASKAKPVAPVAKKDNKPKEDSDDDDEEEDSNDDSSDGDSDEAMADDLDSLDGFDDVILVFCFQDHFGELISLLCRLICIICC